MLRRSASALILIALTTPVLAEEKRGDAPILESQTDFGGVILFHPKMGQRLLGRVVLSQGDGRDRAEAHYGLTWKPRQDWSFDLTGGYVYLGGRHALVVAVWKDMAFRDRSFRLHFENRHRFGAGYAYEGFYSFYWKVAGVHVFNQDRDVAAGVQFGSGHGLLPFLFEIRLSRGLTDGMPDNIGAFVMSLDFR